MSLRSPVSDARPDSKRRLVPHTHSPVARRTQGRTQRSPDDRPPNGTRDSTSKGSKRLKTSPDGAASAPQFPLFPKTLSLSPGGTPGPSQRYNTLDLAAVLSLTPSTIASRSVVSFSQGAAGQCRAQVDSNSLLKLPSPSQRQDSAPSPTGSPATASPRSSLHLERQMPLLPSPSKPAAQPGVNASHCADDGPARHLTDVPDSQEILLLPDSALSSAAVPATLIQGQQQIAPTQLIADTQPAPDWECLLQGQPAQISVLCGLDNAPGSIAATQPPSPLEAAPLLGHLTIPDSNDNAREPHAAHAPAQVGLAPSNQDVLEQQQQQQQAPTTLFPEPVAEHQKRQEQQNPQPVATRGDVPAGRKLQVTVAADRRPARPSQDTGRGGELTPAATSLPADTDGGRQQDQAADRPVEAAPDAQQPAQPVTGQDAGSAGLDTAEEAELDDGMLLSLRGSQVCPPDDAPDMWSQ